MTKDLAKLSKPKQKIAAKVLSDEGFNDTQIGEVLNVSNDTAKRYVAQSRAINTPEKLRQFENDFKLMVKGKTFEGLMLVYQRLTELLPKERRIEAVVKAGEFLRGTTEEGYDKEVTFKWKNKTDVI